MSRGTHKKIGADLTQGSIPMQLFSFVLPIIMGNIIQQLYNAADVMIIGRYVGSIGTVGVSNGGEYTGLVTFVATSFSSAGQIYVAQMAGIGDKAGIRKTSETLLSFLMLLAIAISAFGVVFGKGFLCLINCPQEAMQQAVNYQLICCMGIPAIFGYNAACGILRGMGESGKPLQFIVISALTNVVLDLALVAGFRMESEGTAIATVAAQYAAFFAALAFMLRNKERFGIELHIKEWSIDRKHLSVILNLGLPMVAQSMLIHLSQIYCTALINHYGMVAASANSIGTKINRLTNSFTSGVTAGAGAMVGQNIGARKYDRASNTVYCALIGAMSLSVIFSAVSLLCAEKIVLAFTTVEANAAAIVELGAKNVRAGVITLILAAIQGAFCSVIVGSGNSKLQFWVGVIDSVILRIGISILLAYGFGMGAVGFFYGNGLARLGPVIIGLYYYYSGKWKKRRLLTQAD